MSDDVILSDEDMEETLRGLQDEDLEDEAEDNAIADSENESEAEIQDENSDEDPELDRDEPEESEGMNQTMNLETRDGKAYRLSLSQRKTITL